MSLRRRIMLASAAAVAVAVVLASVLVYVLTSNELHNQIDAQLRARSDNLRLIVHHPARRHDDRLLDALADRGISGQPLFESGTGQPGEALGNVSPRPNQVRGYQQLVDSSGAVLFRSGAKNVTLPVSARTRALAAGHGNSFYRDATVNGIHLRILAEHLAPGRAVQFAQPLGEVDELLEHLRLILIGLGLGGILLAALLGQLVARAAVAPVRRLTRAAEHVAETQDLSRRISPTGTDEIGRLAASFNAMLDALDASMRALDDSVHAQRQLVADASHELRTPITSLRTNIEILQQATDMDPRERALLLGDVVQQIEELTLLMNDLIDLARGEERQPDAEDVRLDAVVSEALERTRLNSPTTPLHARLAPVLLSGVASRLQRAIVNLIDNAVKYSPEGEPVEVELAAPREAGPGANGAAANGSAGTAPRRAGPAANGWAGAGGSAAGVCELTVRDHGPGISPEDRPHVFDRFYRGAEARGRPGSGLGLAIVRQVIAQHGGAVTAAPAPGGGTLMFVTLPGAEAVPGAESGPDVDGDRDADSPRADRGADSAQAAEMGEPPLAELRRR